MSCADPHDLPPDEVASGDPASSRESRRLEGIGAFRLHGAGRVTLDLKGRGCLIVRRGRNDAFSFEGDGVPRHASAGCIRLANAEGRVELTGETLEVEFQGGLADVAFKGSFHVERGRPASADPSQEGRPGDPPAPRIRSRYFGTA